MNKMKRIFSLVLVLSMILGSFGSVFTVAHAAEEKAEKVLTELPSDIKGTEYEKAVARLVAFGIVQGYKDGTYQPKADITRAEFAKLLIESLGIGSAANAAMGKVSFSDVSSTHWARGYINVASGQGLLKGYPDGTFQPGKQVSHAEALTMLVRALGYQDQFLKGNWPGNYIAKAADTGITSGVKFADANGFANRGEVAVLVNNTLDGKIVKVDSYKDGKTEYIESDTTLLKEKLDISKYEDTRIVADKIVNDGLDKDEITVKFLADVDKDEDSVKKSYRKNEEKEFTVKNLVNARKYIGEEISVYMNDREQVVYMEVENDDKAYFDYVDKVSKGKDGEIEEISLVKFDKEYKFDSDAKVYVFNSKDDQYDELDVNKDGIDAKLNDVAGHVGKFVVKNNRIVYAEIMESTEALPWMLVLENKKGLLEGINHTTEDFDMDLSKDGNYDGVFVYDTLGNKLEVEDIKKGNIVYVQKHDYDGDDYALVVVVKDNIAEGKLSKVKDDRVTIDGKQIKVVKYSVDKDTNYQAYYSVEGLEDIKEWDNNDWENDMEDADDEKMTAYLDAVGKIAFLTTETTATSGYKYGVVTRKYADNDRIKIYTYIDGKDGEEITYKVDEEDNLDEPILLDKFGNEVKDKNNKLVLSDKKIETGNVVKFKINKSGEIAEDEFYVMDKENYWVMQPKKDFGKDTIPSAFQDDKGDTKSFAVDNKAVVIDAEGLDPKTLKIKDIDDFGIGKWEDMKEDNYNDKLKYFVFTKRNNNVDVDALVFIGEEGANTSSDEEAIYVTDIWTKGGDVHIKYVSYETGKLEEREVDKLDGKNISYSKKYKERPFIAKIKSSSKVDLFDVTKGDLSYVKGIVEKKDGNVIKVDGKEYRLASNAIVYEEDVKKSASNIRKGDAVYFVVENKVNIRVIERLIDSEAKDVIGGTTPGETSKDKVTYLNVNEGLIEVNDKVLELHTRVKLMDADKNTLAIGKKEVAGKLKVGMEVSLTSKDNIVTEIKLVKEKPVDTDKEDAAKVDELIKELPSKITLADEKDVKAARKAYDKLSSKAQKLVDNLDVLESAEAKIKELEEEKPEEKELTAEATTATLVGRTGIKITLSDNAEIKNIKEVKVNGKVEAHDSRATEVRVTVDIVVETVEVVMEDGTIVPVVLK